MYLNNNLVIYDYHLKLGNRLGIYIPSIIKPMYGPRY
jgi:hypothetical protein